MIRENDAAWQEVSVFLQQHLQPEDRLLAPVGFKDAAAYFSSYEATYDPDQTFDWVVVHKGMLSKFSRAFLQRTVKQARPVFANAVFVVFANSPVATPPVEPHHLQPLLNEINPRHRFSQLRAFQPSGIRKQINRWLGHNPDLQTNQLSVLIDYLERHTSQLERLMQTTQQLEKNLQSLQSKVNALQQKQPRIGRNQSIASFSKSEFQAACRAACQTFFLGNDTVLCRVLGKYFLYADSQDLGITPHLCANGFWETWMTLAVARVLQPGWHCVDVGANHGYYTLLMADGIGETGRILALEPNPKLANLLQRTVSVNGFAAFTTVVPQAAIDQPGAPIDLVIPAGYGMNASVLRGIRTGDEVVRVETTSIDALTADWERVDLIKIDAEGAEALIWQGLQQTIKRNPQLVMVLEFNAARYADPHAFLEAIVSVGFVLRHIDFDAEIKPLTVEQCLSERHHEDWLLFLQQANSCKLIEDSIADTPKDRLSR